MLSASFFLIHSEINRMKLVLKYIVSELYKLLEFTLRDQVVIQKKKKKNFFVLVSTRHSIHVVSFFFILKQQLWKRYIF